MHSRPFIIRSKLVQAYSTTTSFEINPCNIFRNSVWHWRPKSPGKKDFFQGTTPMNKKFFRGSAVGGGRCAAWLQSTAKLHAPRHRVWPESARMECYAVWWDAQQKGKQGRAPPAPPAKTPPTPLPPPPPPPLAKMYTTTTPLLSPPTPPRRLPSRSRRQTCNN